MRSFWGIVGVVGDAGIMSFLDGAVEDWRAELARESPRAGRSTIGRCWVEPKDELDVSDASSRMSAGAGDLPIASLGVPASLAAISAAGELCEGERAVEFFLASALLFLGTSWSLKVSEGCDCAGEACWLRVRSVESLMVSVRFRSVSTSCSDGCLPFSWKAIWGLADWRSAEADRDLFSLITSLWPATGRLK